MSKENYTGSRAEALEVAALCAALNVPNAAQGVAGRRIGGEIVEDRLMQRLAHRLRRLMIGDRAQRLNRIVAALFLLLLLGAPPILLLVLPVLLMLLVLHVLILLMLLMMLVKPVICLPL